MRTSHEVIRNMIRTEKGSTLLIQNKYLFKVDGRSNKIEVKNAVEDVYKVKVHKVHIMNVKGKRKRVRFHQGLTPSWKKAVVTLAENNKIEVT